MNPPQAITDITFDRATLPVLYDCEVLVVGGSFGGVAAALTLARSGRQVALVEPRTYLGREITATLRPWISLPAGAKLSSLPKPIASCVDASGTVAVEGEYPLHMDAIKLHLEDMLLEVGVKLLYASLPVGICVEEGKIQGVIIGNKSGRQVITCQAVVDATATALVARLAGAKFETAAEGTAGFSCTLEYDDVGALDKDTLSVPEHLGLVDNQAVVHAGYRGKGHVLLEYALDLPSQAGDSLEVMQREAGARQQAMRFAEYLVSEVPGFEKAYLASLPHELCGRSATRLAGPAPRWVKALASVTVSAADSSGQTIEVPLSSFAGPVTGVWSLNEAARVDDASQALIRDPVVSSGLGAALAQAVDGHWESVMWAEAAVAKKKEEATIERGDLEIKEQDRPQPGREYELFIVAPSAVPVLRNSDVVVVGGGSSGAMAGIIAGQEGMKTVLVDMNPGLGGTGTYGGIYTYWFARQIGFVEKLQKWESEVHERLGLPRPNGVLARWNIEARISTLMAKAGEAGVEMLLNAYAIGSIVEGKAVRGVVVATRYGPVAVLGQVIIDATGDGDVAASAGADYVYGSEREHAVMYAYMPQVIKPGRPRNVKTSMLDVSNAEDYTRALLAERRRRLEKDHDHGVYMAPRESRHIEGEVVLTFTDQLMLRCFPDVAFIAFSNHDMKGESTSDWIRMGLQAPNLEIEIPYRAFVPKDLENILVVGKAYSATHDALAGPRMMPDLENLGGVAAIAAAMAVQSGTAVREIDVRALQERLVEEGALPEKVLTRTLVSLTYTDEELAAMIDALDPEKPLHSYSDAEIGEHYEGRVSLVDIMCAGPQVVPLLEKAFRKAEGDTARQVLLARMLAILGSDAGVPVLVSAVLNQLSGDELPGQDTRVRHAGRNPPDQGAAPDAAHLIYCLGMAQDPRAIPVWERTVELLTSSTEKEILDRKKARYYYVSAICYGAERLGDPDAISVLQKLHNCPPLCNRASLSGFQPDHLEERLAYLEVLIGRALARCGSPDGYVILINYLDDVRALLAEHAHSELVAVTGQDLGKNVAAWSQWLESEGEHLEPVAWTGPTDPVVAWKEGFLIEA